MSDQNVSIVVPVFESPAEGLAQDLEHLCASLQAELPPHLEIIFCGAAMPPGLPQILAQTLASGGEKLMGRKVEWISGTTPDTPMASLLDQAMVRAEGSFVWFIAQAPHPQSTLGDSWETLSQHLESPGSNEQLFIFGKNPFPLVGAAGLSWNHTFCLAKDLLDQTDGFSLAPPAFEALTLGLRLKQLRVPVTKLGPWKAASVQKPISRQALSELLSEIRDVAFSLWEGLKS